MRDYIDAFGATAVCCAGYEVVQQDDEPALQPDAPLLPQRKWWYRSRLYSKPLLAACPLTWDVGFHGAVEISAGMEGMVAEDLLLVHTHKIDREMARNRIQEAAKRAWSADDTYADAGAQNALTDEADLMQFWNANVDTYPEIEVQPLEEIPAAVRNAF